MKSRKRDSNINGRGIRRGSEAAMVKLENFYFREFDNNAIPFGIRRIRLVAESRPTFRPNLFVSPNVVGRLDTFSRICSPECIQLISGTASSQYDAVSDEVLKQNGEKLWMIQPSSDITFERPVLSNPISSSSSAFDTHMDHSISTSPQMMLPIRGITGRGGGAVSSSTSETKKGPVTSLKVLADRLKQIFNMAITHTELREIQGDELFIDGLPTESSEEVFTPTANTRKPTYTARTESDSSQNSSSQNATDCRLSDNHFHKSATDRSGPDDINDAVSMSESPLDEEYGVVNDKSSDSGKSRNGDGNNDQKDDVEDMDIEVSSQRSGRSSASNVAKPSRRRVQIQDAVRAHVNASKNKGLDTIGRYNLLNMGASIPRALMNGPPINKKPGRRRMKRPSSTPEETNQTVVDRDYTNLLTQHAITPSETSASSVSGVVQTGSEVLDLKSAHLIRNVVEVNPKTAIDMLRRSSFLGNNREGYKGACDDGGTVSSDDESKAVNKPSEKKHSIELRLNEMHNEFLDELQERKKTKYLKGVKIPLKKNDSQTTLQASEVSYTSRGKHTYSNSSPNSSTPGNSSTHFNDEDTPGVGRYFGGSRHSRSEGSDISSLDWNTRHRHRTDKYDHGDVDDRIGGGAMVIAEAATSRRPNDSYYTSHMPNDDAMWYRHRSESREESISGMTMSDTNTIDSSLARSSRYGRDYSFDRPEDIDTRSAYSWRSQVTEDCVREREHYHSKQYYSDMHGIYRDGYALENHEPYGRTSYMYDDRYPGNSDKQGRYMSNYNYRNTNRYYDASPEVYGGMQHPLDR